ncbi:uncharacterized protein LOC144666849 isoform X2 [Oculina patagonica]
MDHLSEPFRKLISSCFGNREQLEKICISEDVDVSSEEDVDRILKAFENPLQVKQFIMEGKQICSFPIQLCYCTNLQKVILCGNQISEIPWSLIYLKHLKELDMSFNALHILPRIVGHIPTLEVISVRNNFITYLPTELLNLPNLKSLDVQDNPLTSPPPEIVKDGLQAILGYLKKRKSRKNLFYNCKAWFSEDDSPGIVEVSTLFELCIKVYTAPSEVKPRRHEKKGTEFDHHSQVRRVQEILLQSVQI